MVSLICRRVLRKLLDCVLAVSFHMAQPHHHRVRITPHCVTVLPSSLLKGQCSIGGMIGVGDDSEGFMVTGMSLLHKLVCLNHRLAKILRGFGLLNFISHLDASQVVVPTSPTP